MNYQVKNQKFFSKNLKYLIDKSNLTQRDISLRLIISETSFAKWKAGGNPSQTTLIKLSRFFTEVLDLPITILRDGQALIDTDLEQLFAAQGLLKISQAPTPPHESASALGEILPPGEISGHEKAFLISIRRLIHGRPDIPAGENSLNQILELEALAGPGSDTHRSIIRMIQGLRHALHEARKKIDLPDSEADKK
jgi:transcriptional regulator with XRE-family HTH domain